MANPILVDAMKYYDERADMNNPKAWDHVLRQYEHALSVPDSPWADVDEATKAEALTVLHALVDLETTTETVWHHAGSSRNRWKLQAEAYRAALEKVGLPADSTLGDLIAHHRAQGKLAGAFEFMTDQRLKRPEVDRLVNGFIRKWLPEFYPHLVDTDANDGQRLREALYRLVEGKD